VAFLKRLALVLTTGYIFFFTSELVFWSAHGDKPLTAGEFCATWLAYSGLAYAVLILVHDFRARSPWAVFLCGAVLGWLAEGVIVKTMYESLPLSIAWTGLAWHALLTVTVGWYGVRLVLGKRNMALTASVAVALGLVWGFWAIFWWTERAMPVPPLRFARYAFAASLAFAGCQLLYGRFRRFRFNPSVAEKRVIGGIVAILYVLSVDRSRPAVFAILPVLLGLTFLALRKNRMREKREDFLRHTLEARIGTGNILVLLLAPAAASIFYWMAWKAGVRWHTSWVVYLATVPAGLFTYVYAVVAMLFLGPRENGRCSCFFKARRAGSSP
jgi:ABC-type xylose transport system permease subunit